MPRFSPTEIAAATLGASLPRSVVVFAAKKVAGQPREELRAQIRIATPADSAVFVNDWQPTLGQSGALDAAWPWGDLTDADALYSNEAPQHVVLETGGVVVATMVTTTLQKVPPVAAVKAPLPLYVERIVTQPRDRGGSADRQVSMAGVELFRFAVLRSIAEGRLGHLALHSVRDEATLGWYRDFWKLGGGRDDPEEESSLPYFDGDELWAYDALKRTGGVK